MIEITHDAQARISAYGKTEELPSQIENRMNAMAGRAVGKPFVVRLEKNRIVGGTITRCEPARIGTAGRLSAKGIFNVWLVTGLNQVERGPFPVARIPG